MVTLMVSQPTSTTVPAQGAAGDAQHSSRRWWALIAIAASVLVVGLDLTVLNLALPDIAVSLHASTGDLQWFSDAYSLVIAALILPAGLLGDLDGRVDRRAGPARRRRGRDLPDVAVGAADAIRPGGAPEGNRHHVGGHHAELPDRADPRRLPARPLLVG